jgi:hypothetical protein
MMWQPPVAPPPPPPPTRRQTIVNIVGVLLFVALYLALDPWSTHFHSTTTEHLLVAEACVEAGECPVLGLTVSETPIHMGPLFFYLLMPAASFGYLAAWQVLLGVLSMILCILLLVREGDRIFGAPVGLLAVPLWMAFEGSEFLVDLRHAPLAAPLVIGALFILSRFGRAPSVGKWVGFCLLFWLGMQLQFSMYVLALPALWLAYRVARGRMGWMLVGIFGAVGAASQLPIWFHYAANDFSVFGETIRIAGESPTDWTLIMEFLAPMAVVLVVLELRAALKPERAPADPVFSLPFIAWTLVGYVPIAGMAQPRYLFPIAALAAVRFSVHLTRAVERLASGVRRRDLRTLTSLATLLLVAVAVIPHLIGAVRTDQSLTPCDTLRGQAEIVDAIHAGAHGPWRATPHVHGAISVDVSQQLEYLLHEREIRAGDSPTWSLEAPCVVLERTGGGCSLEALSWVEYEPCLSYRDALVEVSHDRREPSQRQGIRLPIGSRGGTFFSKGQRTTEGAATADFLSDQLGKKTRGRRMFLGLTIPIADTEACRGASGGRAVRILVDECATILVDPCTSPMVCTRDTQPVHEMHFGDHEPELRVRRLTIPGATMMGVDALRVQLNLTSCDQGLRLLDIYEVVSP